MNIRKMYKNVWKFKFCVCCPGLSQPNHVTSESKSGPNTTSDNHKMSEACVLHQKHVVGAAPRTDGKTTIETERRWYTR